MGGDLNREFLSDPRAFIKKYAIDIKVGSALGTPDENGRMKKEAGVHPFSFLDAGNGKVELCLQNEDDSLEPEDALMRMIQAYWLPWESHKAVSLQLADEASYFFTSALGGCGIYRDDASPPKVSHVAGDGPKSDSEEGQEWRDSKAEKENMNKERRYSGLRDYGALGFAIGFVEDGEWVLMGQSIDIDEESGKWRVLGAREI